MDTDPPSLDSAAAAPSEPRKLSLGVLVHSGKVDELRKAPPERGAAPGGFVPHALREGAALTAGKTPEDVALEAQIVEALRTVYDPEIPVNIYDLGLIYDIAISPEKQVKIKMTLTAPGCPVAGILPKAAERKVEAIDAVMSCAVELVWEPAWTKGMMSEAAQLELGLL